MPEPQANPQQAYTQELDAIEEEIEQLKVSYEQYFLGIERRAPDQRREQLRKRCLKLKDTFMKNTGLRFRMQSVWARFLSYERLWLRTLKEIEDGVYRRDLFKARLHAKEREERERAAREKGMAAAARAAREPSAAAPAEPAPTQAPVPPPPRATPQDDLALNAAVAAAGKKRPAAPSLSPERVKQLYEAYVIAKQRCNESTAGLTPEALALSLRKQIPALLAKHNAKDIDFKVVIKGGKAMLKAVPKI